MVNPFCIDPRFSVISHYASACSVHNDKSWAILRIFGNNSIKQSFSITVFTLTHVSSANGEIVGLFRAGSSVSNLCRLDF